MLPARDERDRVPPRRRPVGRVRVAVLQAQVGKPACAERQADVAGELRRFAVSGAVHPGIQLDGPARAGVLELEVHHAGDGVGAVLRGRAVSQHLDLAERDGGDHGDVRALGAVRHTVAAVPFEHRGAVAALAVDEHQHVVGRQVAEHGGADHRRGALDGLRVRVERRDDRAELLLQVARSLPEEVGGGQDVHRHRRRGNAARLGAGADDDRLLPEAGEQGLHLGGRQSQGLDLGRRHTECAAQLLGERARLSLHLFLRRLVPDFRSRIGSEQGPRRREHGQQQRNAPPRTSRSSFPSGSDHRSYYRTRGEASTAGDRPRKTVRRRDGGDDMSEPRRAVRTPAACGRSRCAARANGVRLAGARRTLHQDTLVRG